MINAYLIITAALFAIAFCGSYSAPYKPTTGTIRAFLFLLCAWSAALLFADKS